MYMHVHMGMCSVCYERVWRGSAFAGQREGWDCGSIVPLIYETENSYCHNAFLPSRLHQVTVSSFGLRKGKGGCVQRNVVYV